MNSWSWLQPISGEIFETKYLFHRKSVEQVFDDIATVISSVEKESIRDKIKQQFYDLMISGKFLPAGRILANAWPKSKIRNFMNCFTIGIKDDMIGEGGIYDALKEDASISKVGGGVGFDVSSLRPKGTPLSVGGEASGPISFLRVFDASAKIIMTGGSRRAAHIALLAVDHPDIEDFITCKQGDKNRALTQFNISVKITDKFIEAVESNEDWDLKFNGKVYRTVKAKHLYDLMVKNAFLNNEPGMFNVDIVNKYNNGYWLYEIHECNPCGEQPIPKYNVCDLGALNLVQYVLDPFTEKAIFDFNQFEKDVAIGVRFLDNVLDSAQYPLEKITEQVKKLRRIGLGFTGLGDTFVMMNIKYGDDASKELSTKIARVLRDASYDASADLAKEKKPFAACDVDKLLQSNFIKKLPKAIREKIRENGLRNIALNTIAPTGTISLTLGQNCSSGIEPIFALEYNRRIRTKNDPDEYTEQKILDYAWLKWNQLFPEERAKAVLSDKPIKAPALFVTTKDISPKDSIDIQAIFQEYVDAAISKTLNLQPGTTFEQYKNLFMYAYKNGLKGFTTFNPEGSMKGILEYNEPEDVPDNNETTESEYIKRRVAPKRPNELECDIHHVSVKGKKVNVLVGKLNGSLYEIFVDDNDQLDEIKYKTGIIRKVNQGRYDLIAQNGTEKTIIENLSKNFGGPYGTLARLTSMALRHGTPLQFVVDQLSKSREFVGFEKAVNSVLKKYIKDGEVVMTSDQCPDCEEELVFNDGCVMCQNCGYSRCI